MNKVHVIAEIAWGHDGKVDQAIALAEAASDAGADSLSIHITSLPDYIVQYYGNGQGRVSAGNQDRKVYEYLVEINLSEDDWLKVVTRARELGLKICVMANDLPSFEFAQAKINPDFYVIPPASMVEFDLIEKIASALKPTLFRIGGSYLGEIEKAISLFRKSGNDQIILLHGFQNYPTELQETDLSLLPVLKTLFNVEVGLADHIAGDSDLAKVIPAVAVPMGVTFIEKHLTLDRKAKSEDFESALEPAEFRKCVEYIRSAEVALGTPYFKDLNTASVRYRNIVRKSIVFSSDIEKGTVLNRSHLAFKRCDSGLSLDRVGEVLGRQLAVKVERDEALTSDKLV